MASLLDQIAGKVYAGFKGKLRDGTYRQEAPSGSQDDLGDAVMIPTTTPCHGFVDQYTAKFREQNGIPETDSKVSVFSQSMPSVTPKQDDKVFMENKWWQVREVRTDPATALWELQCFQIPVPTSS